MSSQIDKVSLLFIDDGAAPNIVLDDITIFRLLWFLALWE